MGSRPTARGSPRNFDPKGGPSVRLGGGSPRDHAHEPWVEEDEMPVELPIEFVVDLDSDSESPEPPVLFVVVKFEPTILAAYEDHAEERFGNEMAAAWQAIAHEFTGITLLRLFRTLTPLDLSTHVHRAVENDPQSPARSLVQYYSVDVPPERSPETLMHRLRSLPGVELAYVSGQPSEPPCPAPTDADEPYRVSQSYLNAGPDGVGANAAWRLSGGDGDGIQVIDIEQGWTLNHEDLRALAIERNGQNRAYHGHGTAVLGVLTAADNGIGCIGLATAAKHRVVSEWRTAQKRSTADAVNAASAVLAAGDVMLIEAQLPSYLPVEAEPATFVAIRAAADAGIVVVEAAGNGQKSLDNVVDAGGQQIFLRAVRDSGAILIGAGTSGLPHARWGLSNYGSRVDCYAWGENVSTTGDGAQGRGTRDYTRYFHGTSSAAAIIAGVAAMVQGMAAASAAGRFTRAGLVRALTRNDMSTLSANPAADLIGVMPDLGKLTRSLNVLPR